MVQFLSFHHRHPLFVWFFVIAIILLVEHHHHHHGGSVFVASHGCPAFTISDSASRAEVLMLSDTLFPSNLKSIVEDYPDNSTILTGVYDCHHEEGGNEVGVAAICEPGDDGECTCVALYNFVPCQSCMIDCYDDDDLSSRKNITINSFKADCSNVIGNGLTTQDQCNVGCRFDTTGCFASQGSTAMNVTTPSTTNMTMGGGGDDKGGDDKGGDDKGGDDKNGTMTTTASSPTLSPVVATAPTMTTTTTSGSGTIPTVTKPAASAGSVGRTAVGTATTIMAVILVGTTAAGLLF